MGRGKIEIKRIENPTNRQVTFSKRKGGLMKKAKELAILTDAQVGLIIFGANTKLYEYCSLGQGRMGEIIHLYFQNPKNNRYEDINNHPSLSTSHQLYCDIMRMRHENDKLQASMNQFTGEDLTGLTINELEQLEVQLDYSAKKVRDRVKQLWKQQTMNVTRNVHMNQDQINYFCTTQLLMEQQQEAVEQHRVREMGLLDQQQYDHILMTDEEKRNLLQLGPQLHQFQLQPTQPNLQEYGLLGHGLQL